jgi:transposase
MDMSKWFAEPKKLEKVCSQYELQWLLCAIILNYQSISDFRKQRPSGLKNLFKLFVSFLKDTDFLRCKIIAIDGAKSRADIAVEAHFNQKKIWT